MRDHRPAETRRGPAGRPGSVASGDSVLAGAASPASRAKGGFWVLAAILGLFLVASTAPSPLYGVYAARFHFSPVTITTVFAVYALALLTTLLVTGSLSDAIGRRPVIFGALGLELVSVAFFLVANSVVWLYAGRIVQGVATGAVTGAVSAALVDLEPPGRPGFAALVGSATPAAGFALGALVSGALVQYGPVPLRLVYALILAGFVVLALALRVIPEPGAQMGSVSLRPRIGIEPQVRMSFLAALPCLVATYALSGIYLSLGPSLALRLQGSHNLLFGALDLFLLGAPAVAAPVVLAGRPARPVMLGGCGVLVLGVTLTVIGIVTGTTPLFLAGTTVAGAGYGAAFLGAFRTLAALASPTGRGALVAAIYIVCYLSVALPVVVAGILVTQLGLRPTSIGYGIVLAVLAAIAIPATLRATVRDDRIRC